MLFQAGSRGKDVMLFEEVMVKETQRLLSDVSISFDREAGTGSWVEIM